MTAIIIPFPIRARKEARTIDLRSALNSIEGAFLDWANGADYPPDDRVDELNSALRALEEALGI